MPWSNMVRNDSVKLAGVGRMTLCPVGPPLMDKGGPNQEQEGWVYTLSKLELGSKPVNIDFGYVRMGFWSYGNMVKIWPIDALDKVLRIEAFSIYLVCSVCWAHSIYFFCLFGQGTAEIVSHCMVNKQMASASSYIFRPNPGCDWSTKKPSIIWSNRYTRLENLAWSPSVFW